MFRTRLQKDRIEIGLEGAKCRSGTNVGADTIMPGVSPAAGQRWGWGIGALLRK